MDRLRLSAFTLLGGLLILVLALATPALGQEVIYVDAGASSPGDGTSWSTAYPALQDAFDEVNRNEETNYEIWVAEGTYYPDVDNVDNSGDGSTEHTAESDTSFTLTRDEVEIYGGFSGEETNRSDRNPEANIVVLSGDVAQDDDPFEPNADSDGDPDTPSQTDHIRGTNSIHVVYLDGTTSQNITGSTVLDGMTITAGRTNGPEPLGDYAAGLYCGGRGEGNECSPLLSNLVFRGNLAIDTTSAGPKDGAGGALGIDVQSDGVGKPTITNSTFRANTARFGGALHSFGFDGGTGSPTIKNSIFVNNAGSDYDLFGNEPAGGAVFIDGSQGVGSPLVKNVLFAGNTASFGGAFENFTDGGTVETKLVNVVFVDNAAEGSAFSDGGALLNNPRNGGVIQPTITNATFASNTAGDGGGAVANYDGGTNEVEIANTILWSNSATNSGDEILNLEGNVSVTLNYSIVEGGDAGIANGSGFSGGTGNLDQDPQFENLSDPNGSDGQLGTGDDGLRLKGAGTDSPSPAIDAGENDSISVGTDVLGNNRVVDGSGSGVATVDIGAYEAITLATRSVTVDANGEVDFGDTGADINFSGVSGSGEVTVAKLDGVPANPQGISESHVSTYRFTISASGDLTFDSETEVQLDTSTLGGIDDASNVTIYKRPTEGTGGFTALSTSFNAGANELVAETGSFSEFVLASNSEPLPVDLAGFEATVEGGKARLTWQTASETNSSGFVVERKDEGGAWTKVGFVDSKTESGTSSEVLRYRFTDTDLPYAAERLDYRLRQVDTDGTTHLSRTVTVERGIDEVQLLGTYPNPARKRATVRYALPKTREMSLKLYDVLGRQVRTFVRDKREGRHEIQTDLSGLSSGTYFLRLTAGGETCVQKLTVVR